MGREDLCRAVCPKLWETFVCKGQFFSTLWGPGRRQELGRRPQVAGIHFRRQTPRASCKPRVRTACRSRRAFAVRLGIGASVQRVWSRRAVVVLGRVRDFFSLQHCFPLLRGTVGHRRRVQPHTPALRGQSETCPAKPSGFGVAFPALHFLKRVAGSDERAAEGGTMGGRGRLSPPTGPGAGPLRGFRGGAPVCLSFCLPVCLHLRFSASNIIMKKNELWD